MVRAPCCEKMGLKKGPWTPEEDQLLINYIKHNSHGNWRALPKQAGLLRCGKSCRLRWINYLRPDIKRGNFTREEEDTIINLHEMLGNRWSAIAARLPGRTDNEIKNIWHTHLKKRLKKIQQEDPVNDPQVQTHPQESTTSRDLSSVTSSSTTCMKMEPSSSENNDEFVEIDDNFWTQVLSVDNDHFSADSLLATPTLQLESSTSSSSSSSSSSLLLDSFSSSSSMYDNMDFWYNLFTKVGDSSELP